MAVAEWIVLMHKYPGLKREEIEGKTEEEVREMCRYKQLLKMPNIVKYRELFKPAAEAAERFLNNFRCRG